MLEKCYNSILFTTSRFPLCGKLYEPRKLSISLRIDSHNTSLRRGCVTTARSTSLQCCDVGCCVYRTKTKHILKQPAKTISLLRAVPACVDVCYFIGAGKNPTAKVSDVDIRVPPGTLFWFRPSGHRPQIVTRCYRIGPDLFISEEFKAKIDTAINQAKIQQIDTKKPLPSTEVSPKSFVVVFAVRKWTFLVALLLLGLIC